MTTLPLYHLDFETYSEEDLTIVGAVKYASHPSTEILCSGYCEHGSDDIRLKELGSPPEWMFEPYGIIAHHVDFEYNIIKWQCVPCGARMPDKMFCTMAMAQSMNLPGALDKIPKVLGLEFAKDKVGHNAMMRVSKPRKPTKNKLYTRHTPENSPHYFEALYTYCKQDVFVEMQLYKILPKLNPYERKIWEVNFEINNTIGTPVDVDALSAFDKAVSEYKEKRIKMLPYLTAGQITGPDQIQRIKDFCAAQGVEIDSLNKDILPKIIEDNDTPNTVREVLKIRLETGGKAVSKYTSFRASEIDGRLYNMFKFCGAGQTRRFSGARVQLQNLHKGYKNIDPDIAIEMIRRCGLSGSSLFYSDMMKVFNTCLRGMIMTDDEHVLGVGDYSAIEAIVVMWLADEKDALQKIREGVDLYIDLAEFVYKKKVVKQSRERDLGKASILGCGFGMGVVRFIAHCASYGIEIDEETARQVVVDGYRARYPKVVAFWYDLQRACMEVIRTGISKRVGRITVLLDKTSLPRTVMQMILPCGARLTYWNPTIERVYKPKWEKEVDEIQYYSINEKGQWVSTSTWGGKLVENVVQATARGLLAWSLVRLYQNGFKPVLHVHDEIGCEFNNTTAENDLIRMKALMEKLPKWAVGLPLKIGDDAWIGRRYRK